MTTPAGGESRWEGRRRAREAALQILYQTEVGHVTMADAIRTHDAIGPDAVELDEPSRDYAVLLAGGAAEAQQALDGYIADAARNWRVERLAVVDRVLLRLAVHELLDHPGTPPRVVIDEAIELARRYSGEDAAKFVNGVLDGVYTRLKEEGKVVD
ncbi:MAG TPA: transcription antitermination factor NusB [Vicinamibacterales bacterium]|nr:transcription antitermination factor NusB [Vicinamibacterales bacterium]